MKVSKLGDRYLFYQDGADYILGLGTIKRGEDTTTEILFEDVENPKSVTVVAKCGCTATNKEVLSNNSFSVKIKYKECETTFSKTVVINEGRADSFKIKIKGLCR